MTTALLDTSVVIAIADGSLHRERIAAFDQLVLASLTVAELRGGVSASRDVDVEVLGPPGYPA